VKKVGNDLKIVNFWILNNSRDICDFGRYLLSSSATSNGRHLATLECTPPATSFLSVVGRAYKQDLALASVSLTYLKRTNLKSCSVRADFIIVI
jgi:hypothetical protein